MLVTLLKAHVVVGLARQRGLRRPANQIDFRVFFEDRVIILFFVRIGAGIRFMPRGTRCAA